MKIAGLKVFKDNGWKAESTFTTDDGRTMPVPASHKAICTDEKGEIVNLTLISPAPVSAVVVGKVLPDIELTASVGKNQFAWTVKGVLVKA